MAQVPYEFLARWNHLTGVLKGAHVKLYDNVTMQEGDAQSVEVAGASGFPLTDIMTALQSGAVIAMDDANASLTAEQTAHASTQATLAATQATLAATQATLAATQATLAATQAELSAALAKLAAAGIP